MGIVLDILGTLGGIALGAWAGLWLGARSQGHPGRYWAWNAVAVVVGTLVSFAGQVLHVLLPGVPVGMPLALAGVGMIGGGLTGLRYGFGQPLGPYAWLDRWTRAENLPEKRDDE